MQVRLFDGTMIRKTFSFNDTLERHVRPWVRSCLGDNYHPFEFEQILPPSQSPVFWMAEELETLEQRGLVPNTTLVTLPIIKTAFLDAGGLMAVAMEAAWHAGVEVWRRLF